MAARSSSSLVPVSMTSAAILNAMKARYVEDRDEWSAQTDLDELYE